LKKAVSQRRKIDLIKKADKGGKTVADGWQNTRCERTIEKREGIKNTHQVKGEKCPHKNKEKEIIFPGCSVVDILFRF
jgi:hypothetical protein